MLFHFVTGITVYKGLDGAQLFAPPKHAVWSTTFSITSSNNCTQTKQTPLARHQ